ncbi:hypothetical protein [Streptomyces mirabilis]|uniref:hypothetical protein n=1 Tax=Streptomyces mirabilis TaxID=68239 RepID=UPI0036D18F91
MPQSFAPACLESNSPSLSCDCLARRFGNTADRPARTPCDVSDMTEAEWRVVRAVLPVPAWLEGRGGIPREVRGQVGPLSRRRAASLLSPAARLLAVQCALRADTSAYVRLPGVLLRGMRLRGRRRWWEELEHAGWLRRTACR